MKKYLLKRLLRLIPVFLGVTILAFLLTGLSSVDAVDLKESSSGGVMSEAEKEAMREELGLNEPKAVQYLQWLKNALRGDFGESYVSGKPVLASFCEKLPATIALAALALAMTVCLSFPLGILSAKYQNTWADRSISLFCFAGNSFPGFFTALLLLSFFSLKWNLFRFSVWEGMEKLCASGGDACGFDDGKIHPSGAFCRACRAGAGVRGGCTGTWVK